MNRSSWIASVVLMMSMLAPVRDLRGQPVPDAVMTALSTLRLDVVAEGLATPVALAFLPDGRAILAERSSGTFSLLDPVTGERTPIAGMPPVLTELDGGALDVVAHPDFSRTGWLFLAYSEAAEGGSTTVLDRARLAGASFVDRTRLFTSGPPAPDHAHFGGRIALADGYVFLSIGDRQPRPFPGRLEAQSLAPTWGRSSGSTRMVRRRLTTRFPGRQAHGPRCGATGIAIRRDSLLTRGPVRSGRTSTVRRVETR